MVVITEKELKKRAEHNYGRLHNLEEVRTRCCCCCCGLGGGCGNLVDHIDVVVVVVVVVVVHDNIIKIMFFRSPCTSCTSKRLKTLTNSVLSLIHI